MGFGLVMSTGLNLEMGVENHILAEVEAEEGGKWE